MGAKDSSFEQLFANMQRWPIQLKDKNGEKTERTTGGGGGGGGTGRAAWSEFK